MQSEQQTMEPQVCPRHPSEETYLTCSRCGEPVCPRCMVYAHVGIRCPACARAQRVPTYDVRARHLVVASGIGLGGAVLGAIAWTVVAPLGFIGFIVLIGLAFGLGHVMSQAVNKKRGRVLQAIAGGSVLASYLIAIGLNPFLLDFFALFVLFLAMVAAVSSLR